MPSGTPERFGPLAASLPPAEKDAYTSQIFGQDIAYQKIDPAKHKGYHQAMFVRAEMCAACHDVTNALPIKNPIGNGWAGSPSSAPTPSGPIARMLTARAMPISIPNSSAIARAATCSRTMASPEQRRPYIRMESRFLRPWTAWRMKAARRILSFTHHFVGGNAYVPGLIGKDVDQSGNVAPYPELSAFSFSSADEKSPYSRGFWTHVERKGAYSQQARLAWDRLRHVLSMDLRGARISPGQYFCAAFNHHCQYRQRP